MKRTIFTLVAATMTAGAILLSSQETSPAGELTERGDITLNGQPRPYVIHRLPINAFPQLPPKIVQQLDERGCLIPQTYEAHRPENVVHGSFDAAGSDDWAVLCSARGTVSLLVFLARAPEHPAVLSTEKETHRLQEQHGMKDPLGFNWGIDRATPAQVHDAQSGIARRPPPTDHDALADSVVDRHTIYRFYSKGHWVLLDMPN